MKILDKLPWRRIRHLEAQVAQLKSEPFRREMPAAGINRLTADWRTMQVSIDTILNQELDTLCARAEELQESSEYFQKFLTMMKTNVVGEYGMVFNSQVSDLPRFDKGKIVSGKPDRMARSIIEASFAEWGRKENCLVSKDLSWWSAQNLFVETFGTRGETLWRKIVGKEARNKFNFALQPIATGRIDTTKNENLSDGGVIRLGVEKDSKGTIIAYWLRDSDPGDFIISRGGWTSKRYDAKDFIHVKLPRRIGQSRGWPWAAAAMMRLRMLAGYDEAEIEAARAAACKMGFITKTGDGAGYSGPNADGGGKYMEAEPGALEELPIGMDVSTVDWNHPNSAYPDFTAACKMGIACGLSMSYPRMFGDYGSINFSAGRLAQSDDDRVWCFMHTTVQEQFYSEVFNAWLESALLSNAVTVQVEGRTITLPAAKFEKFKAASWMGPRSAWFDPVKEIDARTKELNSGQVTLTELWAKDNRDRDEMFEAIAADQDELRKRGIVLPGLYEHAAKTNPLEAEKDRESAAQAASDAAKKTGNSDKTE